MLQLVAQLVVYAAIEWWQYVIVPLLLALGAALRWLLTYNTTSRKEQRVEDRNLINDEFRRLRESNEAMAQQIDQLGPKLGELRREYAEAVAREVALLEKLRELSARAASASEERRRLKAAIRLLSARVSQLRDIIVERTDIELPEEVDPMALIDAIEANEDFEYPEEYLRALRPQAKQQEGGPEEPQAPDGA